MSSSGLVRLAGIAYWTTFAVVFLAVAVWESFEPRAKLSEPAERRWRNHAILLGICAIVSTMVLRVSPVVVAVFAADSRFGILNKPWLPLALRCAIAVLLLDLLQYWTHWTFHHVGILWRVHRVHHSDANYDVSTAGRFHPLEVLYTQSIQYGVILLLAPPALGVAIAQVLAGILNLSSHANASLPRRIERLLGAVFITPDLHRIHHAREQSWQMKNLGQTFAWWDRLFGSYFGSHSASDAGKATDADTAFPTGLRGLEGKDSLAVGFMLAEPFQNKTAPDAGLDSPSGATLT